MADILHTLSIWALPVIFAITLHEAAHAWTANRLGDPTSALLGRVSFNPMKHIDPFGTLLLPGMLLLMGAPFVFGWAKPVPVIARNLRRPQHGMAIVAMAGPLMNFALALLSALCLRFLLPVEGPLQEWIGYNLQNAVIVNVVLCMFNLLPILPLDGGRILNGFLPPRLSAAHARSEKYGFLILIGLVVLPSLTAAIGYPIDILRSVLGPAISAGISGILSLVL